MRLDTLTRQRDAEGVFFVIFVNGAAPRSRKSHQQKEDADSLIVDKGHLQDGNLCFPNILSTTQREVVQNGGDKLKRSYRA